MCVSDASSTSSKKMAPVLRRMPRTQLWAVALLLLEAGVPPPLARENPCAATLHPSRPMLMPALGPPFLLGRRGVSRSCLSSARSRRTDAMHALLLSVHLPEAMPPPPL
jgi:hypothetical protein